MMQRILTLNMILFAILPVLAQDESMDQPSETVERERLSFSQDPGFGVTDTGGEASLSLDASSKQSRAQLRLGSPSTEINATQRRQWSLVLSGKLDDESKVELGDLDGLNDDITAEVKGIWYRWRPAIGSQQDVLRQALCKKDADDRNAPYDSSDACEKRGLEGPNAERYKRMWDESVYTSATLSRWAFNVKAGYSDFDFLDEEDLSESSNRELGWSLGLTYSRILPLGSVWSAGARHEASFKDADSVFLCQPGPVPEAEVCEKNPLGGPIERNRSVVFTEWRAIGRGFAISPKVSYDLDNSTLGVRIPVWLVRDPKRNFTSGLRLDWNNDDKDATVSLFVTTPLSLFSL